MQKGESKTKRQIKIKISYCDLGLRLSLSSLSFRVRDQVEIFSVSTCRVINLI
jgi:hypothetical protein